MSDSEKSLKEQNFKWLCAFIAVDAIIISIIAFPWSIKIDNEHIYFIKFLKSGFVPVIVLLIASILPSEVKEMLVFWRISHVLPGNWAFSYYAVNDDRFNVNDLKSKVGEFPSSPAEENILWYRLYNEVKKKPSVLQAHKKFLLYRELSAISLLLTPVVVILVYIMGENINITIIVGLLCFLQYLFTSTSAMNEGIAFVKNVLAEYVTS